MALIEEHAGVRPHLGKTRCWGAGSPEVPPGIELLGDAVWRGDRQPAEAGIVMLGSAIGTAEFVELHGQERLHQE